MKGKSLADITDGKQMYDSLKEVLLDDYLVDIIQYITNQSDKIKAIYRDIREGNCRREVKVVDANYVFHMYKEYLEDMMKYINKAMETNEIEKLNNAVLDMIAKDKEFFSSVAVAKEEKISDAMKNVELVLDLSAFFQDVLVDLGTMIDEYPLPCLKLYSSSVVNFSVDLIRCIKESFEIISGTIDGTVAQMTTESVEFKMF